MTLPIRRIPSIRFPACRASWSTRCGLLQRGFGPQPVFELGHARARCRRRPGVKYRAYRVGAPPINIGHRQRHGSHLARTRRPIAADCARLLNVVALHAPQNRSRRCSDPAHDRRPWSTVCGRSPTSPRSWCSSAAAELPTQPGWAAAIRLSDDKWAPPDPHPAQTPAPPTHANASKSTRNISPRRHRHHLPPNPHHSPIAAAGNRPQVSPRLHGLQCQRRAGIG